MRMRNLTLLLAVVLLTCANALAQQPPPAPAAPPKPYIVAPDEPTGFSLFLDAGNYLGIQSEVINRENMSRYGLNAPRGVGISRVSNGSPAEKAGLKTGDVILQFDGEPVTSPRKLSRLINEAGSGQTVRLTISRSGSEQQLSATLGEREDRTRAFRALTPPPPAVPGQPRAPQAWGLGTGPEGFAFAFGSNRRIGITTTTLTKQLADYFDVSGGHGLLITSVSENGPAAKAGLKAGDVVTEVSGEKVNDTNDFVRALNRKEEGEVTLTIIRDKSQRTIKVTPEKRQAPNVNLSGLFETPAIGRLIVPSNLPEMRAFELTIPYIEALITRKIKNMVTPRVMTLPRIDSLRTIPNEF